MKISDKLFKRHILEQNIMPSSDSHQYVAYLILSEKYHNLTYWSMDGWSCDALADYSVGLVWNRHEVVDWESKEVILTTEKSFWESTTQEIIKTWMKVNGETSTTKTSWLRGL